MRSTAGTVLALTMSMLLAGCDDTSSARESNTALPSIGSTAPPPWILAIEPDDAASVLVAKATASEGTHVVVRGRIGGRRDPLTPGSTVFTIVDLSVPHCAENPDDKCPRPWDYCCVNPETLRASAATVQIVDAHGHSVSSDAAAGGLEPLDEVVLIGTVGPRPNPDVLMIQATGVHRMKR